MFEQRPISAYTDSGMGGSDIAISTRALKLGSELAWHNGPRLVVCAIAALAFAACSASSPSAVPPGPSAVATSAIASPSMLPPTKATRTVKAVSTSVLACELFTPEIGQLMGATVIREHKYPDPPGKTSCSRHNAEGQPFIDVSLDISFVGVGATVAQLKRNFAKSEASQPLQLGDWGEQAVEGASASAAWTYDGALFLFTAVGDRDIDKAGFLRAPKAIDASVG